MLERGRRLPPPSVSHRVNRGFGNHRVSIPYFHVRYVVLGIAQIDFKINLKKFETSIDKSFYRITFPT